MYLKLLSDAHYFYIPYLKPFYDSNGEYFTSVQKLGSYLKEYKYDINKPPD